MDCVLTWTILNMSTGFSTSSTFDSVVVVIWTFVVLWSDFAALAVLARFRGSTCSSVPMTAVDFTTPVIYFRANPVPTYGAPQLP